MTRHQYQFPIESERISFRLLTPSDKEAWKAFFTDNPHLHFVGVTNPKSPEEESQIWVERQMKRYGETGVGILAACLKETGELIGNAGIIWRDDILGKERYEIGYSVTPQYWNQGFASEMAIRLKEYFQEHQIDSSVISIIHVDNIGSQKVAEKNGMSRGPQFEFLDSPCYLYEYHF
ncbi:GNAT family N-acetyltransferase [Roseivirga sp.]|uniref:GNAT family N-acetyltransferase n=1 Tax=Roseivirga sp. TaxID=1964215 RepID=UPI003B52E833